MTVQFNSVLVLLILKSLPVTGSEHSLLHEAYVPSVVQNSYSCCYHQYHCTRWISPYGTTENAIASRRSSDFTNDRRGPPYGDEER
jgi:hypothetical protein